MNQFELVIETTGRGTLEVTHRVADCVARAGIDTGLCHLFVCHTSASLMICENADAAVRRDVERFLSRLAPDGSPEWEHDAEGPDDMPAHIRSLVTGVSLSLPVREGRLALGTWQGVFLYEHRSGGHRRRVIVTLIGG